MGLLTVEELREVISVKVLAGDPSLSMRRRIRNISTDSRSIRRGDLFVALKGERFDGHDFVQAVLAKGATGAIVHDTYRWEAKTQRSSGISRHDPFLFGVRDPLFAYQQLGPRSQIVKIRIISVQYRRPVGWQHVEKLGLRLRRPLHAAEEFQVVGANIRDESDGRTDDFTKASRLTSVIDSHFDCSCLMAGGQP